MDWDAISAIAELLAAIGVVASLLYLATQIKQVKRAMHLNSYSDASQLFNGVSNSVSTSPELARVLTRAKDGEDLEKWEQEVLQNHLMSFLTAWDLFIEQSSTGGLELPHDQLLVGFSNLLKQNWVPHAWGGIKGYWPLEWQGFVDKELKKAQSANDT
ncbi:MAG: hypothetical protein AB8B95_14785 [Pseudohongiellaceae bacterium]